MLFSDGFYICKDERVRVVLESYKLQKKRPKLSNDYYMVQDSVGNGYLIRSADKLVVYYLRCRLVQSGKKFTCHDH